MRVPSGKSGFTLVETMIAVTILSLVIAMVYSCWAAVVRASESSTVATQDAQRERTAMLTIEQALSGAVWYDDQTEPTIELDSVGHFSRLTINNSRVPPGFLGPRELKQHPLRRIEFVSEANEESQAQLVMYQQAFLAQNDDGKLHRTVLLPRLEEFSVDFKQRGPLAEWTNEVRSIKTIPAMARVSLGSAPESPRTKTIPVVASLVKHARPLPGSERIVRLNALRLESDGLPDADSSDDARVVFIIDKSASMSFGNRLEIAKSGVSTTLNKMADSGDSKFAIYTFNKSSDRLGSGLLRASNQNVQAANAWLKTQSSLKGRQTFGNQGIIDCIQKIFSDDVKPTEIHLVADSGFLRDLKSNNPLNVRGALSAYNDNFASFNIYLLESFGKDLDRILATSTGAEMDKIVRENKGTIYLINGIY